MKKILFTLFFAGTFCYGQSSDSLLNQPRNRTEVKLNLLSVSLGAVDLEFERTINRHSSFGISLFTKFNDDNNFSFIDYDSGVSAFYRYYFGKKYAQGFFLEGFGTFHNTQYLIADGMSPIRQERNNNLLVGLGIGYKHIFKNGIILQAHFGIGRNLFNDSLEKINGKIGISIGYRF